jgi:hypothetical protein
MQIIKLLYKSQRYPEAVHRELLKRPVYPNATESSMSQRFRRELLKRLTYPNATEFLMSQRHAIQRRKGVYRFKVVCCSARMRNAGIRAKSSSNATQLQCLQI